MKELEKLLLQTKPDLSSEEQDTLVQEARALRKSDTERAEQVMLFLCSVVPHNAYYWTELALCKMEQHAYRAALQALGTAAVLAPSMPLPYFLSAVCYACDHNSAEIPLCLEQCMELSKERSDCEELYEIARQCHNNNSLLHQAKDRI